MRDIIKQNIGKTILILFISSVLFTMFIFSFSLFLGKDNSFYAKVFYEQKKTFALDRPSNYFSKEELTFFQEKWKDVSYAYQLIQNNEILNFSFLGIDIKNIEQTPYYNSLSVPYLDFDIKKGKGKLIGSWARTGNEIVITSYLADWILKIENKNNYQDLVGKEIHYQNNTYLISGILEVVIADKEKIQSLTFEEIDKIESKKLIQRLDEQKKEELNRVYVTEEFIKQFEQLSNTEISFAKMILSNEKALSSVFILNEELRYYDGAYQMKSKLDGNELILNIDDFSWLVSKQFYDRVLEKYKQEHLDDINYKQHCFEQFIKDSNLLNQEIDVVLTDTRTNKQKNKKLKLIGVTEESGSYVSSSFQEYVKPVVNIGTIMVSVQDEKQMGSVLDELLDTDISLHSLLVENQNEINHFLEKNRIYFLIISMMSVGILFVVLFLFYNKLAKKYQKYPMVCFISFMILVIMICGMLFSLLGSTFLNSIVLNQLSFYYHKISYFVFDVKMILLIVISSLILYLLTLFSVKDCKVS